MFVFSWWIMILYYVLRWLEERRAAELDRREAKR